MIAQLRPRCETAFVEALCRAPSRYPRLVAMYRTSTPPDALAAVLAAVTVLPLDDAMPLFEILQMQPWERSVPPTAIPPGLGRALFAWSRRPPDPTELLVNHYEQLVPRLCRVLAEADRRVLEDELADAVITSDPESTFAPVWRAIAGDAHVHWRRLVSLAFIPVVAELVRARLAASEAKRPSGFEAFLRDVQK